MNLLNETAPSKPVFVIGAGGHAKVLIDLLLLMRVPILRVLDIDIEKWGKVVLGYSVLPDDNEILSYSCEDILLVNGLGSVGSTIARKTVFDKFMGYGYHFATLIHPQAFIGRDVVLQEGVQIMAGAIIQTGCQIGRNSIVNTRVVLEHDCKVGDHVHLSPGSVICGDCVIEDGVHIGAGSTVIQGMHVGNTAIVGAGAVVVKDVISDAVVVGVPAEDKTK